MVYMEADGRTMVEELKITEELTEDLLNRLGSSDTDERETAAEALAVSTEDEGWRPNELIRQGGIETVAALLHDDNPHIVLSAISIIIAVASAGEEEALISGGVIARLDPMREHADPAVRKRVQEALWLLEPEVEEVVTSKPQNEY